MASNIESGKKAAAYKAVEDHVKSKDVVGIGSGSTIVYAVEKLAELVKKGNLVGIKCIPTSFQVSVSRETTFYSNSIRECFYFRLSNLFCQMIYF